MHRAAGERGERRGADEAQRVLGHHDVEQRAVLHQPAGQRRGLVGGDPAGDAEQHAPVLHGAASTGTLSSSRVVPSHTLPIASAGGRSCSGGANVAGSTTSR